MSQRFCHDSTPRTSIADGFSLVELSIVLVILGLLVGGVLAGQSLIKAAELRSVSADLTRYTTAIYSFRDKYRGLPGDITNATSFWGAADNGDGLGTDCGDTISTGTETCNGDGNGELANSANSDGIVEKLRLWQHLANAGLLEGQYAGAFDTGPDITIGRHFPPSRMKGGGFEIAYQNKFYRAQGNVIKLAAKNTATATATGLNGSLLTAAEAWSIDRKLDDGLSDSGRLMALDRHVAGCVTNGTLFGVTVRGSYMLGNTARACAIYYFPGF